MPQINLLSTETKAKSVSTGTIFTLLARLFALAFFAVLGYYGFLFFKSRNTASEIVSKQANITKLQNEVLNNPQRGELLARQGQLQEFNKLVDTHPYWSQFFPELARVTLRSAYYTAFSADGKGAVKITAIVPTYAEFDQFLSVFDKDGYYDRLYNVRVSSVSKFLVGQTNAIKFEVELTYDPELIKQTTDNQK